MNKFSRIVYYGGIEPEEYECIASEITESNRKNLIVFSSLALFGMLCMVISSFFVDSLVKNRTAYILSSAVSAFVLITSLHCTSKNKTAIYICMYTFIAVLLLFGIDLGTFVEPNEVSVSFPILLFAIPLLFTTVPLYVGMYSIIGIIAYIIAAKYTQSEIMYGYNMSNIIPYGIISILAGSYLMLIKIHRHILEYQNRFLIESDQLTGLLNRRSFEKDIDELRKSGFTEDVLICAFDVNGLKSANDRIGHHAGDEMIRGAAQCIRDVFEPYGKCYRVGGDEFVALFTAAALSPEQLGNKFNDRCKSFKGEIISEMSISCGIVRGSAAISIDELLKLADKIMYAEKARHYSEAGKDRRKA